MKALTFLALLAATTTAQEPSARIQTIMVGGPSARFSPDSISASPGDIIRFTFLDTTASIAQTSASAPCTPQPAGFIARAAVEGAIDANSTLEDAAPVVELTVSSSDPVFIAETRAKCGSGSVFTINASKDANALFKRSADADLEKRQLVAAAGAQLPAPVASTVSVKLAGNAAPSAAPAVGGAGVGGGVGAAPQASVVPGQGSTGSGAQCGCNCLCGAGNAPPAGVASGAFGGVVGMMPMPQAGGPAPPAGMPPAPGMPPARGIVS
ncbi:hypothetical protein BT63DRAFT_133128 [Microthyrium microscopicum]|uniref:Cupredoxin n=1 Tax=Microthyrium microscopicum TaxID=703497 RepID=A0A6A6UMD0_9PEZI|nr:hypothetical protein BT63DRAFT_133128 [Microthyrium microscopicum]